MRLPLSNLADVVNCEGDPTTVLMKRDLPAVCTSPQRAFRQLFEPQVAEDLRRLNRKEDAGESERTHVRDSHSVIITVMQITSVKRHASQAYSAAAARQRLLLTAFRWPADAKGELDGLDRGSSRQPRRAREDPGKGKQ